MPSAERARVTAGPRAAAVPTVLCRVAFSTVVLAQRPGS